jgi:hypothetical protein
MNIGGFDVVAPRRSFLGANRRSVSRFAIPLVGVPLAGVLATAAYAAWTTNGSGTASAKAGTSTPLTTSAVAVTTGLLYPNGPAGDVKITINNPNPYPVRVTQVAGNGAVTAAGGTGTCATTGVSFTTQNGTYDVAANSSATFTLSGAASMSSASEDGCQNATFTIPVALTGASN